jgi:protocatechuate 3,4-dioxygenase beta subunit
MDHMKSITRTLTRREALAALGAAGLAAAAAACGSPTEPTSTSTSTTGTTGGGTTSSICSVTPEETAGPYPDRLGMINNPAYYRQDITEGKAGLPLALTLTIVNARNDCAPISGATVEIWQCDADGNYSEYSSSAGQTFLRGLQKTDASGVATFRTIYPGWYQGRATHIHVEVFVNSSLVKTTQIAFPESTSASVYRTGVYASRGQNTTSNARDNVFADGVDHERATIGGDPTTGLNGALTIVVSV